MQEIPLVIIAGPTAVGKSATAVELAKQIGGEIVSADSMQIYKHMNIGTAKPTKEEMQGIPHYLIDEIEPDVSFNVVKYANLAHRYLKDIAKRGKMPILVGGTGLYIDSVAQNTQFAETIADEDYRKELLLLANEKGNEHIYAMLEEIDPQTAQRLHPNDLRRVIRALEVYKCSGISMSDMVENSHKKPTPYKPFYFGLTMERDALYQRINDRVDRMMEQGLVEEVKELLDRGVNRDSTAMNGIGYKEVAAYLDGEAGLAETTENIKQASRRYAKRQMTWFRKNDDMNWIYVTPYSNIQSIAKNCKNHIESY